jgi:hypothetical protein
MDIDFLNVEFDISVKKSIFTLTVITIKNGTT